MRLGEIADVGECRCCGDAFALRDDGMVRYHRSAGRSSWWCEGSDEPPTGAHVHVCHCGARWDEDVAAP